MLLLYFGLFIFIVLFVSFMVTQVIFPIINEKPLFPMFQSSTTALEGEIVELEGQLHEEDLVDTAENIKSNIETRRRKRKA